MHRCEVEMARNLSALRAAQGPRDLVEGAPLVERVFFYWDASEGEVTARLLRDAGELATFEVDVRVTPRWLNIVLELGDAVFAEGEAIGLAMSGWAETPFVMRPYLRTGPASDERGTLIGEPIEIGTVPGTAVRLQPTGWREAQQSDRSAALVLPLPQKSFRFTLTDMRLFVLPAGSGLETGLPVLGGQAA